MKLQFFCSALSLRKTLWASILLLLLTACNSGTKAASEGGTGSETISSVLMGDANDDDPAVDGIIDADDTAALTVTLQSLILILDKTSFNKDENTTVKVTARYEDGTSKDVTDKVEWIVNPKGSVAVTQKTLTAKKDNPTTLKAKVGNKLSNTINLNITWTVNGHTLPPEPDKILNDSTLLGIDINNNGVRDDVERYIYKRFTKDSDYSKTKIALAMQYAWATQKILETPTIDSKRYLDDSLDCASYWIDTKTKNMSGLDYIKYAEKHKIFNETSLKDKFLNTKLRILQKFKFNEVCSGHIFHGRKTSIDNCQTNIDLLDE